MRCQPPRARTCGESRHSPACRSRWCRRDPIAPRRSCCSIRSIDRRAARSASEGKLVSILNISWHQYNTAVERLALTVHESGYAFNQIICIARGGLLGDDELAILSTHSYTASGGTIRGELVIAEHMTMTAPRLGERVLLVDDMVDSGHTLAAVHDELPKRFPSIVALKSAVLWWKGCSVFKPDYHVDYLPDNPWINQPFEVYDKLRPADLKARLAAAEA